MKKNKILNFIVFLPFAFAIGAFIVYIRYALALKNNPKVDVLPLIEIGISRYRNIAIFCLILGIILIIIKSVYEFIKIDKYPVEVEEGVLDRISTRKINSINNKPVSLDPKLLDSRIDTFSEEKIINTLLNDKILKVKFLDSKLTDKLVKFNNYNLKNNTIELTEVKKETVNEPIRKEFILSKLNKNGFKKCPKCNNTIADDAVICVHCGTSLVKKEEVVVKETKKEVFNPIKFVLNIILILLCIILILLFITKINDQNKINKSNLNIKTVETN